MFLSRNGRLPFEVFSRLGETTTGGIGYRYLRLSRDALRVPSADAVGLDHWLEVGQADAEAFLCEFDDRLTLAQCMSRIGLDPARDAEAVHRHGLDPTAAVAAQDRAQWARFLDDDDVRARLHAEAHRSRRLLVDYFDSHGVYADRRVGVVDIGWTGQQAAMMSACLDAGSGDGAVQHFHLGREHAVPLLVPTEIHRFLFDGRDRPVNNPIGLYELFTATSEPGMAGLRRLPDGRVEAELRDEDNRSNSELVEPLHRLVAEFTDELAPSLRSEHLAADLRAPLRSLARTFWFEPTPAEGRVFGGLPWEVDASGHVVRPFAQPIALRELPRVLRPGGLAGRQWSVGAVAASRWPVRWLLTRLVRWKARRELARS